MLISNIEEEIKCPICKEYISENIRKTACDHLFCDKCITRWLANNTKCPLCRLDLRELIENDNELDNEADE